MAKTTIDIDATKAAKAQAILGTDSLRSTVDAALQHVIAERARERFIELAASGAFADLLDPATEEAMWK
ncbi:type II toxin-antitoxin system VapB family antitoxin [Nonomuraea africana]|uniref:Arc/MetJ family transcription regulator n=1 Tax=Nonomuraea africana TaxID=46171 RepID=A0ABR9KUM4_9ACTN|nr:type II toxin-antitoxin system VapB family antitoxin [Nonomuraea africana]MBE1565730.1 Arc/MetJ family transcription regulator [Nonomuraea africana]